MPRIASRTAGSRTIGAPTTENRSWLVATKSSLWCCVLTMASLSCWSAPAAALAAENPVASSAADARSSTKAVGSPLWATLGLDRVEMSGPARRVFESLSTENLEALSRGASPEDVITMTGESLATVAQKAIGTLGDQLVYTPLTPCRLLDTGAAVGSFTAGETRHYNFIGPTDYSSIGGNPAGCGIPGFFNNAGTVSFNTARALLLNLTVQGPGGSGFLVAWPTGEPAPGTSVLNYSTANAAAGIANGLILKTCGSVCVDASPPFTCGDPCPAGDLSITAGVSGGRVIADVVGYLDAADLRDVKARLSDAVDNSNAHPLTDECQELNSCSITTSSEAGTVLVTATARYHYLHTFGTASTAQFAVRSFSGSCGMLVSEGVGLVDISRAWPSTPIAPFTTITVSRAFSQAAGTSSTYYLNAMALSGDFTVYSSDIHCLFIP